MALIERLLNAVGLSRLAESSGPAMGVSIDPDDHLYRSLSSSSRDISPLTQDRVLQLAGYLYETNPLARRIAELTKDFVVGDGFTVSSPVPEIHAVLTKMWNDPITDMHSTQHLKALELGMYGEQIWPVFVNVITGHVRLGVVDPLNVAAVLHDPDNRNIPIGVLMKKSLASEPVIYRVIYPAPDGELFSVSTQHLRNGYTGGECFYFAVNKLSGQSRGRSDFMSLIDWLDGYDRYLFDTMERSALINAFVWDVVLKGEKQAGIDAWLAKNGAPPKPGTVRAHNESEEWTAQTPDMKHADSQAGSRLLRNHVLGGSGTPEHWFSEGGDVNRSTAAEMSVPVFRRLQTRQNVVKQMLSVVCRYQITQAIAPPSGGRGPLTGFEMVTLPGHADPVPATDAFTVQASNVSSKDLARAGTIFLTVSQGVSLAVLNKLMRPETAVRLLAAAANELGVDINPQDELAAPGSTPLAESETTRLYGEIQAHLSRLKEAGNAGLPV